MVLNYSFSLRRKNTGYDETAEKVDDAGVKNRKTKTETATTLLEEDNRTLPQPYDEG